MMKTTSQPPKILLVEENPLFAQMIQSMLCILGAESTLVTSSDEALLKFNDNYDLVLLDLRLSNMNSFELAKQMRAIEMAGGKHTPIIGNTAETNLEEIEALSLEADIDCSYPKINNLQELYLILLEWIARPFTAPTTYLFPTAVAA